MGLMDVLQPFATGYLEGKISIAEAKAEAQREKDKLLAEEASAMRMYTAQQQYQENKIEREKKELADSTYNMALAETGDELFVEEAKKRGKLKTPESYNAFINRWITSTSNPAIFQNADFRNDWRTNGGLIGISEDNVVNNLTSNDGALAGQKNTGDALIKTKSIPYVYSGVSVQKTPENEVKDGSNWASKYMPAPSPTKPTKPEFMTDLSIIVNGKPIQRLVTVEDMIAEPFRYVPYKAEDEKINKDLGVTDYRKITESNLEIIFPGKTGYQTGMQDGVQVSTFRFFGNDQEQEAIRGYNNSWTTALTLVEAYKNAGQELPEDLVNNLNLYSTDANVANPFLIGNSVANLFADVKEDLTENFSSQIDEMQQIQKFETFREITSLNRKEFINTYGNEYIDIYSQAKANGLNMKPILVAQSLADVSMGEIRTFDELVAKRDLILEGKERTLNIQKEDDMAIVRSYPEFSTDESVKEFVDGYLTADNLETKDYEDELILGLKELAKSEYDFMLLVEEAEKYIESIDPDNFQKSEPSIISVNQDDTSETEDSIKTQTDNLLKEGDSETKYKALLKIRARRTLNEDDEAEFQRLKQIYAPEETKLEEEPTKTELEAELDTLKKSKKTVKVRTRIKQIETILQNL
jgi:hypothetical protein